MKKLGRNKKKEEEAFIPPDVGDEIVASGFVMRCPEKDPNGIDQHSLGAKLDDGKPLTAQILGGFSNALAAVVDVGTKGAKKYTVGGWRFVEDGEKRYANAEMRHKLKRWSGEDVDPELGVLHLAQEAWNILAQLEIHLCGKK